MLAVKLAKKTYGLVAWPKTKRNRWWSFTGERANGATSKPSWKNAPFQHVCQTWLFSFFCCWRMPSGIQATTSPGLWWMSVICGSPLFNRARVALLGTVRQSSLLAVLFGGCCVIILLAEEGNLICGHWDGLPEMGAKRRCPLRHAGRWWQSSRSSDVAGATYQPRRYGASCEWHLLSSQKDSRRNSERGRTRRPVASYKGAVLFSFRIS